MTTPTLDVLTLPLRGIQLIEASAGTGKTWSIASLYVRLILGHDTLLKMGPVALMPRDILVVTFTKAATQELQDRIRNRLNETAQYLRQPDETTSDGFLKGIAEIIIDPHQRLAAAYRLNLAAESMDDAAIFTIHGWCQRMLRQHAFDSGSLFEVEVVNDTTDLLRECARDYWRTVFYPLSKWDLAQVRKRVAETPESLLDAIRPLIDVEDRAFALLETAQPRDLLPALEALQLADTRLLDLESSARSLWHAHVREIEDLIRKAVADKVLDGRNYSKIEDRFVTIATWAREGGALDEKVKIERFATGSFKRKDEINGIEPDHEAFRALRDYLDAKASTAANDAFRQALWTHAASWIRDQFEKIKNTRAIVDQDDLIAKLHRALTQTGDETLAGVIRTQYPVALIDEFQDTDPLQYEIFKRIYGNARDQEAWLMVGDPKQSIYGFRGADIFSYLDARGQEGVARHTLDTNYRSTPSLVDAVNRIFLHGESHARGAFNFQSPREKEHAIPFDPVKAKGRSERLIRNGDPIQPLTFWYHPNEGEVIALEAYRKVMAEIAANEIASLLNASIDLEDPDRSSVYFKDETTGQRRPLSPSDIAILVQDRHDARAIRETLFQRGLRSVYLSDSESVLKTQEAQDIALWLEAFLSPREGRRIRSAMATPTLNLSFSALEALNLDDLILDETITRFVSYARLWHDKGILPAIRQFILDQDLPSRLIQTAAGERSLTNLLHLAEYLQTESTQVDGDNGLLRHFKEAMAESGTDDENILRLESDSALIRVITIHKSKGLQYPLVFLPFVSSSKPLYTDRALYAYHDENLALKLSLEPGNPKDSDSPVRRSDQERLQEALRLFYVALTRAEQACWIGVAPFRHGDEKNLEGLPGGDNQSTSLHRGALGYLIAGGQPLHPEEILPGIQRMVGEHPDTAVIVVDTPDRIAFKGSFAEEVQGASVETFKGPPFERWSIDSYSHLVRQLEQMKRLFRRTPGPIESGADDRDDEEQENDSNGQNVSKASNLHAFPAGKAHGDYLHKLLETVGGHGFDAVAQDPILRRRLINESLKTQSYGEAWAEPLDRWLDQFLKIEFKLDTASFCFSRLTLEDTRMEMEFWFEVKQTNLKAIDALITEEILPGQKRPSLREGMLNGMLKGFMDLTFRVDQRYYVADYKSNRLGTGNAHYSQEAIEAAVLEHRYDLQYAIYLLALHRYLKSRLQEQYDYDAMVGGAAYFFLRGIESKTQGLHFLKPKRDMIEALDRLFEGSAATEAHDAA